MIDYILQDILVYSLWEMTEVVGMVVFLANTVSMWLPNHSKYPPVQFCLDLLNKLSLNVAKNANRLHDALERQSKRQQYNVDEAIDKAIERRKREESRIGGAKP